MSETLEQPSNNMRLPDDAKYILEILNTSKKWMSRSAIAKKMGKRSLNGADLAYLDVMELNNIVEVKRVKSRTPIGFAWEYRAVKDDSEFS